MILLKELCAKTGLSRRTIQRYEGFGLIGPEGKNKYGYLLYGEEAIEKARWIHFLQEIGLSMKEIVVFQKESREEQKDWIRKQLVYLENEKTNCESLIRKTKEYLNQ